MANSKMPSPFRVKGRDGWRAQVTLANGSRPAKDFDTHAEARDWIAEQLANANTAHEPRLGGPTAATLAVAIEYYATTYTVNKGGAKTELDRVNQFIEAAGRRPLRLVQDGNTRSVVPFTRKRPPKAFDAHNQNRRELRAGTYARIEQLANKRCSAISKADIRELMSDMQREGLSPSTIQKAIALLRHLFNVAANEWDWRGFENPCAGIKLGKSQQRFVFLTPEQEAAMWQALGECDNPLMLPLVGLAIETTLRKSSLLGLRWEQIDLAGRVARTPSKTGDVDPAFSLNAMEILRSLPSSTHGKVFPMSANAVDMAWDGVRCKIGLPTLQFRDLRHLGATSLARRGLNAHQLQRVLGHKTPTQAQVYVNLVQLDVIAALDAVHQPSPVIAILDKVDDPDQVKRQRRSARLTNAVAKKLRAMQEPEGGTGEPATPDALADKPQLQQPFEVSEESGAGKQPVQLGRQSLDATPASDETPPDTDKISSSQG